MSNALGQGHDNQFSRTEREVDRNNALEEAAKIADEMTRTSTVLLVAGEMTARELRLAKAIAACIKNKIRDLKK